jgi:hypothetical protein
MWLKLGSLEGASGVPQNWTNSDYLGLFSSMCTPVYGASHAGQPARPDGRGEVESGSWILVKRMGSAIRQAGGFWSVAVTKAF